MEQVGTRYRVSKFSSSSPETRTVPDSSIHPTYLQVVVYTIAAIDAHIAKALADKLYASGIFVASIVFPIVARYKSRIRIQISAKLNFKKLDDVISKLETTRKELRIIH